MPTLSPILTTTPNTPPNYSVGMAETLSWIPIEGAGRPLYAQATYTINPANLTLNPGSINIGAIEIKDGNSSIVADVESVGGGNALRVLTQELDPFSDTISIGDKNGNTATINSSTSSLNVHLTNTVNVTGSVSVTNQLTGITVLNPVTAVSITNQLTGITVLNPVNTVYSLPIATQLDAFGRLRTSSPLTLFDSSHRYKDNNLWSSLTAVGSTYSFNPNQGLVELTVSNLSGSSVIRETTKVFSYQPGKSLIVLNTFVMAPSANNLRQRVGYFGANNGIYLQLNDGVISFVKRTSISGLVTEDIIPLSSWNGDKLDGSGPSGLTLDITKAQIMWMDIEWLGVGTVRIGFVIDGQFIVCHSFHHANIINSTYITTASLPLRYEITNKNSTSGSNTLKQICSTVISEGGYELRGLQQAVTLPITSPRLLPTAGTFYPLISLRLNPSPDRLDAIVILTALSLMGIGNGINYNWQVVASGTTAGGIWTNVSSDSAVEYNITGTGFSGGRILASGFLNSSNQGSPTTDILKEALFKFQLERNGLTGIPYELAVVVAAGTDNERMFASMDWEEITR